MLAESSTSLGGKDADQSPHVANLMVLYRSCVKQKHPWAQEMAKRYEQELRQLRVPLH
jgi:hypothetical protein